MSSPGSVVTDDPYDRLTQAVCAVWDSKAELYRQPFFAETFATAVRAFAGAVGDPNHEFNRHAEDYTLFAIAAWNPYEGSLQELAPKKSLATAWSIKATLKE